MNPLSISPPLPRRLGGETLAVGTGERLTGVPRFSGHRDPPWRDQRDQGIYLLGFAGAAASLALITAPASRWSR